MDIEEVIATWHAAVNNRDEESIARIVAKNVVLGGPKGNQQGREEAISWVHRSRIMLKPVDWHPINEVTMVVEELARWPGNEDSVAVFVRYEIEDEAITGIQRFVHLSDALEAG